MVEWGTRPASMSDVSAVAELRAVVMRPDLERLGRYDEERVRQRLLDNYEPTHTRIIEVDGEFAGCVALRQAEDAHWLEHFYLAPHLQHDLARNPGRSRPGGSASQDRGDLHGRTGW
ncbi:hypothetical protein ACFY1L_27735, partial [Streptomyces sp. NPDC001663]